MKALFFIVRREEPPRIPSVTELYMMLREAGYQLPGELEEQLYVLNKYYTITRYPDAANGLPSESIDRVEAERAVRIAEEVVEHAEERAKGCLKAAPRLVEELEKEYRIVEVYLYGSYARGDWLKNKRCRLDHRLARLRGHEVHRALRHSQ